MSTRRKTGAWVLVIGGVIAVFATVRVVQSARDIFDWTRLAAPGSSTVTLSSGRWAVYEDDTIAVGHHLGPSDVEISGGASTIVASTSRPTLTVNGVRYRSAVEFTVPSRGVYVISIGEGTTRRAVLARPFGTTVRSVLLWGLLAGLTGVAAIVGLVLVLLGDPRPRHLGPAPGWYQDPYGGAGQRWWDGVRWTEHTAPPPR